MSNKNYTTTYALETKLLESLKKKAEELEEYKKQLALEMPVYETTPEDTYEKPMKYQRETFVPKTDEENEKTARDALQGEYEEAKKKTANSILSKISDLEQKKQKQSQDKYYALDALGEKYEQLKQKAGQKMIDRGLGRSSIKTQLESDIQKKGDDEIKTSSDLYDYKIDDLSKKIEKKENDMQTAMDDYDQKFLTAVEKQVASLKAADQKKYEKVEKENQRLDELEREERLNYEKAVREEYNKRKKEQEQAQINYDRKLNNAIQSNYVKRYYLAKDLYLSMDPKKAYAAMSANPQLHQYLGDKYYNILKEVLKSQYVD